MKILKFSSTWCSSCVLMEKRLESLGVDTINYDIDKDKEMFEKYGIINLPTLIFLDDDGKEIKRKHGIVPSSEILNKK